MVVHVYEYGVPRSTTPTLHPGSLQYCNLTLIGTVGRFFSFFCARLSSAKCDRVGDPHANLLSYHDRHNK